jgi:hypothetical protein
LEVECSNSEPVAIHVQSVNDNTGRERALPINTGDVSLGPEGSPCERLSADPTLPLEIAPGESQLLAPVFSRPGPGRPAFRLLSFSAERSDSRVFSR